MNTPNQIQKLQALVSGPNAYAINLTKKFDSVSSIREVMEKYKLSVEEGIEYARKDESFDAEAYQDIQINAMEEAIYFSESMQEKEEYSQSDERCSFIR